ncbi:hypothetical protein D3C76_1716520 [compost metagenome]
MNDLNDFTIGGKSRGASAQHDGITGFEAKTHRVHRHVWTGFVHDADYAKRHTTLYNMKPVRAVDSF